MSLSDADLIRQVVADDDRSAFQKLLERHQSSVRHFLRHLTRGDHALADDLAQDTFVRAYHQIRQFRGESTFSSWLLGIAHNYWRNAHRKRREHAEVDENTLDAATANATHSADLRHDVENALRGLTSEEQLAIHLGYQQGKTHHEIARLLDWPLGTVKTHIARGKEKLRRVLAAWNS